MTECCMSGDGEYSEKFNRLSGNKVVAGKHSGECSFQEGCQRKPPKKEISEQTGG